MAYYRCGGGLSTTIKNLPTLGDATGGVICSFRTDLTNALNKLKIAFSASQDLHGYSKPWIGGAGKNKIAFPYYTNDGLINGVTWATNSDGKIIGSGLTTQGTNFFLNREIALKAGTYTVSITGKHSGMSFYIYDVSAATMIASISSSNSDANTSFTLSEDKSSINIYFNIGSANVPVDISAYIQLELGNQATSFEPYENICPITGFSQANVFRMGKNLCGDYTELNAYINASGVITSNANERTIVFKLPISGEYTLSGTRTAITGTDGVRVSYSTSDTEPTIGDTVTTIGDKQYTSNVLNYTFTIPNGAKWLVVKVASTNNTNYSATVATLQLEFGSTATNFVPYHGNTYLLQFGDTYYGCEIDVVHGKLRVLWGRLKMSDIANWSEYSSSTPTHRIFTCTITGKNAGLSNLLCEIYANTNSSIANMPEASIRGATDNTRIYVCDSSVSDVNAFISALGNYALLYELATPIEVDIDSAIITALTGEVNQVYCDIPTSNVEELQFFETVGRHIVY